MDVKKEQELWILKVFEELCSFSICNHLLEGESPDFIAELNGKKIGIEITEIYQDSILGYSRLKQQSSHKQAFTEVLISKLQKVLPFTFGIDIDLDFRIHIKKSDFGLLAAEIIRICYSEMLELEENFSTKEFEDYSFDLPEGVKSITITRIEGLTEPHNYQSEGGGIPILTNAHLDEIIRKKEQKLSRFKPCDEYWLLIREGNYHSGSFGREPELHLPIKSLFTKIYLVRTNYLELIEVK